MRFEDLIVWQKARELTKQVYFATRQGAFAKDFGLSGQMQRSAVSITSNIAEGFERAGQAQFRQFLLTAKASCAELRSQLYTAYDVGYLEKSSFSNLIALAEEVGRLLGGLRLSIEKKQAMEKVKA